MGVLVHTETLALELEYFLVVKTIKSKAYLLEINPFWEVAEVRGRERERERERERGRERERERGR